jgi:DNA-binding LacI/PurR family transcriptional regulator
MIKVTTHDVARRAGVSQPTVSLVLSGNPRARVAEGTRARVLRAAEELGYRPNMLARGLVQQRSYALGVMVPDLGNPFFSEVVRGVERVAAQEGYAVLLCDTREATAERHLEALRDRVVDGVIIDAVGGTSLPESLLAGLNVMLIDEPSERWPGIASDALQAGRLVAEHLLALGHRELAMTGPAEAAHGFRMRERGFVQVLRGAGLSLESGRLRRAPATVQGGMDAMRALLARSDRPTAVFCVNDLMALGALKACLSAGVGVPGGLSIAGCDDIEMASVVTPELTTVAVPARELGARAARQLLQTLKGGDRKPASSRPLPVHLVVRGSTAAPADRAHPGDPGLPTGPNSDD